MHYPSKDLIKVYGISNAPLFWQILVLSGFSLFELSCVSKGLMNGVDAHALSVEGPYKSLRNFKCTFVLADPSARVRRVLLL